MSPTAGVLDCCAIATRPPTCSVGSIEAEVTV
jgi:hypothetical protein